VSGIVDRLEHKGLVHRRADAQDRRFVHIQLDPQVTEYLSGRMPSSRSSLLTGALRRADASQRELILCGLAALRQLLEAKPGSPRAPGAGGHEL
jgi:DNA-binding MarR family transcriptional regulator